MTFTEFFNKWNGKKVEVTDPTNLYQCFDLVLQWCIEIGIPKTIFPFNFAYQIYTNYSPTQAQYFDRYFNDPNGIPREGDIMVWSYYYNYAGGHTAICKSGSLYTFEAFSQNDPFASPSILKTYNYSNVLGWLRPKNYNLPLTSDQLIATIKNKIITNISDTDYRLWERKLLGVG
jgi:hypothetical protein